jgi:hypothetical protein
MEVQRKRGDKRKFDAKRPRRRRIASTRRISATYFPARAVRELLTD